MMRTVNRSNRMLVSFAFMTCSLSLAAGLGGCDKKQSQAAKVEEVKVQKATNEAIARQRWPEFLEAFSKTTDQSSFKVKMGVPLKAGGEADAWVQVSSVVGNNAAGPLLDAPAGSDHKKGDRVTIQPEKVKDWSYVLNGKKVGDFTAPPVPPAGETPTTPVKK